MKQSVSHRIHRQLSRRAVFWVIFTFFVVQATWLAITSLYPMAFDEDFHLGIIKLYAHHPSPLWAGQPIDADAFGSIATDPSYFYHFLMSFPYKLIAALTTSLTVQVITLRLLNVALFASGLWLWRRLLRKAGGSESLINISIAFLVLLPMTTLLAAQINYDNLIFPLTALVFLSMSGFMSRLSAKRFPVTWFLLVIAVTLCASLVKYAFLPILLAIAITMVWLTFSRIKGVDRLWRLILQDFKHARRWPLIAAGVLAILFVLLFVQRDVVNVVHYKTPVPDCAKVLSVKECSAYGPWNRDYILKMTKTQTNHNPLAFGYEWFYGMWMRSLFAVAGPTNDFATRGPLVLPGISLIVGTVIGFIAVLARGWAVIRRGNATLRLMIAATLGYIIVLWLDGYEAYVRTGKPVAINGRYLIPLLLVLLTWAGMSLSLLLKNRTAIKLAIAGSLLLGLFVGGGALTYILRSDSSWYWNTSNAWRVNQSIQQVIGPVVPGYRTPTQFLR